MRESRRARGGIVAAAGEGGSPSIAASAWVTGAAAISSRTRFSSCARYWNTPRLTVALRIPPPETAIPSAGALSPMPNLRRRETICTFSSRAMSAGMCGFMAWLRVPVPVGRVQSDILQRTNARPAQQRAHAVRVVEHHVRRDRPALEFEIDAGDERCANAAADATQRRRRRGWQANTGGESRFLGQHDVVGAAVDQNVAERTIRVRSEPDENQIAFGPRRGRRRGQRQRMWEVDVLHAQAPTATKAKMTRSASLPSSRSSLSKRSADRTSPLALTAIHWLG